ncbi:MAG: hypothetical protein FRX49_00448 [Trebouxia sp. A1-2]|nr:MAG: hypothetical protein FRX49_00448 [Trebouxia sp. A1-2]
MVDSKDCVCAFRDNVSAHLESAQTSDSERQHILSILQRFQQDDGSDHAAHQSSNADSEQDDDNDLAISEALLQKLSLSEGQEDLDINEEDLTAGELQAFKRAVASGRLNNMVQIWTPWWNLPEAGTVQLSASGAHRMSVQDQENGGAATAVSGLPAAPSQPLPLLASLTNVLPSPLLQWQLLDILYTYCFVMRLYNGDYSSDPQEAAMTALQVSSTLEAACSSSASQLKQQQGSLAGAQAAPRAPPVSASEALLQCAERVCSPAVAGSVGRYTAIGLLQDVASLVQNGKSVVILVLNDLRNLFAASQDVLANGRQPASVDKTSDVRHTQGSTPRHNGVLGTSNKDSAVAKKQVKGVLRKLHFLLSWANELSSNAYNELLHSVVAEMEQHASVQPESRSSDHIKLDPFVQSTLTNQAALKQKPLVIEDI